MSLRQKGIEVRFNDFIDQYFSYTGFQAGKTLTPTDLIRSVIQKQLYESTLAIMEDIRQSWVTDHISKNELVKFYDMIHHHFHFSKFYLFLVNRHRKTVEIQYSYPNRINKEMLINKPFIQKLLDENSRSKCVEAVKNFFKIEFPNLEYLDLISEQEDRDIQLLFYQPEDGLKEKKEEDRQIYRRLLNYVFNFFRDFQSVKTNSIKKLPRDTVSIKSMKPSKDKEILTAGKSSISAKKINLYQRLISQLPLFIGDRDELDQAAKFLLQVAHLSQVVICNGKMKEIYGSFSLTHLDHNQITGSFPVALKEMFIQAEKKHLARRVKSTSGKYFLVFLSAPLHPQKKVPDFPFSSYLDTLEKVLIRHSASIKRTKKK